MKIFVSGATGFLGRHLCASFFQQGNEVLAQGRRESIGRLLEGQGAHFWQLDLGEQALEKAFEGVESVVHCAALSSPFGRPGLFDEVNVRGTEHLLLAMQKYGVKKLVHVLTPSLYMTDRDQFERVARNTESIT